MKKLIFFLLCLGTGFADSFILENITNHPTKSSRMAIQWASSAREIEEGNQALRQGLKIASASLQAVSQIGAIRFTAPAKAEYFRVLVWSKGKGEPDLHTNWVQIVPDKTYTLDADHLVPSVLMSGMGC